MNRVDIDIVEFKSPGLFYGCEITDSTVQGEFQQLDKLINDYYNNEQMVWSPHHAERNEVCIAQRPSDKHWYRVRVEAVYNRRHGPEASCNFLDTGRNEMVAVRFLRKAAQKFLTVPYQVKTFCLYGIKALTLAIHEDLSVKMEKCLHWDSATITFVHKYLQESQRVQVENMFTDGEGTHHVNLYLHTRKGEVCLNDELVLNNYGTRIDTDLEIDDHADMPEIQPAPAISRASPDNDLWKLKLKKSKLQGRGTDTGSHSDFELSARGVNKELLLNLAKPELEHTRINLSRSVPKDTSRVGFSESEENLQKVRRAKIAELCPPKSKSAETIDTDSFVKHILTKAQSQSSHSKPHEKPETNLSNDLPLSSTHLPRNVQGLGMMHRMLTAMKSPRSTPTCVSDSELIKACPTYASNRLCHTEASSSSLDTAESGVMQTNANKMAGENVTGRGDFTSPIQNSSDEPLMKSRVPQYARRSSSCGSSGSDSEHSRAVNLSKMRKNDLRSDHENPATSPSLGSNMNTVSPSGSDRVSARLLGEILEEGDIHMKKSKMVSKLQGNRLLERLSGGSSLVSGRNTRTSDVKEFSRVFVQSSLPISPYRNIEEAPLAPDIKQIFREEDFVTPTNIQTYVWPGVFRGSHIIGLSPTDTGKTYAYLAPLVTELLNPSSYTDLPIGNGPLAIILVPSWRKAQDLYDITCHLVREAPKVRPLFLYGGGSDNNQFLPLINGCEILIATPPSLGRVMRDRYTDLERLCHLVIDDADTLLELYTEEVQTLMSIYAKVSEKLLQRSAPHQMILMATQWCQPIESFADAFIADPIIILTSAFEAAIFSKVKQEVMYMHHATQRDPNLIDLLDSILADGMRVIIFASTVDHVFRIVKLLSNHSLYALQAHHDMELYHIQLAANEWRERISKNAFKILVCTDPCIPDVDITDAHAVIHYDLSASKTRFGNRLACMRDHYQNHTNSSKESEDVRIPTSYMFVTDDCKQPLDTIIEMFKRMKMKIPAELKCLKARRREEIEYDEGKEFCSRLKAFGACRQRSRCQSRHVILPKVDKPLNKELTSGEVKVFVTHVIDASHSCVRVLEHRKEGSTVDMSASFLHLAGETQKWFANAGQRVKLSNICTGDLCALEEDDTFHRVQILDIIGINSPGCTIQAKVWYVDDGRRLVVAAKRLYVLPSHLKSLPFQTMDMYICRVQPVDKDESWTANANAFTHELMKGKVLDGRIVLTFGNSLWLDPVVERRYLKDVKTTVNEMFVRSELLKNKFAVNNPTHLQQLYSLCKGKIEVPDINKERPQENKKNLVTDFFPDDKDFHDVYLSAVDMPDLIFLQRREFAKRMEAMVDEINERFKAVDTSANVAANFTKDLVCLGKFNQDNRWYRVRILEVLGEDKFEVLYVDFGDKEVVYLSRLYIMPTEYADLPLLAIECQLGHISPRGDEWREESGDSLWDMSHTVLSEKKLLIAKVVSKLKPVHVGVDKFEVELYETSTANDVNLAQELVWSGLASPKSGSNLKELCPRPPYMATKLHLYKNVVQKIPDLCACVYWNVDQKRMWSPQQEILETVTQVSKSSPLNLVNYGGIAPIIKLIGRIVDPDVHQCLLEALLRAAESCDRLAEEILNQDGPHGVIQCLEQKSRPKIQEHAILAIDRFVTGDSRFLTSFSDVNVLEILCDLLDTDTEPQIIVASCKALSSVCKGSRNASELVYHFKVCSQIQRCMQNTEDLTETQALLLLLSTLVERNRNQEHLHREKLARAVACKMEKFYQDEECLKFGTLFCENFGLSSRKNKTLLLELGLAITLNKALELPLSKSLHDRCSKFLGTLVVRVPKTETILNTPLNASQLEDSHEVKGRIPPVLWSQNIYRVMLNVKVRGVKAEDNPIMISEKTFTFRAKVEGNMYVVRYELYDKIVPDMCRTDIKVNEVLVSLRKAEKGKWPRLLRQKGKQPNLSIDFERYVDSSSDSDLCDDEHPFVLKKNKKPRKLPRDLQVARKASEKYDPTALSLSSGDSSGSESDEVYDRDMTVDRDPYDIFGTRS